MYLEPIQVLPDFKIVDGQHRYTAAKELKEVIYYEVVDPDQYTIETIRQLNNGKRNWGWLDYAHSFSDFGNKYYSQLIQLYEEFHERFTILLFYSMGEGVDRHSANAFREGEFTIHDYEFTRKMLTQLGEAKIAAQIDTREFAYALYKFMRTPKYDHDRLLEKLEKYGDPLRKCWTLGEYLFTLDEIYQA